MQPSDFSKDRAGQLLKAAQGFWAFNPTPLPPPLTLTWELAGEISAADRALSELAGVARTLPNPHLLISPFIRREAILSSRIEGTQASLSDLFFYEASPTAERRNADVQEVANYVHALEYGLARLTDLPLSTRLFREMHERLMAGVGGEHLTPGEFRRSQNWIGPPGCTLMDATFVPPPVPEMNDALNELERFLHTPSPLPPLVRLALVHYQFEAIYPFLDGNGRMGRLLLTLLFCTEDLLPQPLLYLSAYFERRRDEYYQGLLGISRHGRWMEWVIFFLRGVALQARDAIRRSTLLLDLQKEYRDQLLTARSTALTQQLMESLFSYPALTIAQAAERLGTTTRTGHLTINKLIDQNILQENTGRARNRVFVASRVIEIIEAHEIGIALFLSQPRAFEFVNCQMAELLAAACHRDLQRKVSGVQIDRHRHERQAVSGEDFQAGTVGINRDLLLSIFERRRGAVAVDNDLRRFRFKDDGNAAHREGCHTARARLPFGTNFDKLGLDCG